MNETRDPRKAQSRFRRRRDASPMATHMCKPNAGVHPEKTPRPTEQPISLGVECSRFAASQSERADCLRRSQGDTADSNALSGFALAERRRKLAVLPLPHGTGARV